MRATGLFYDRDPYVPSRAVEDEKHPVLHSQLKNQEFSAGNQVGIHEFHTRFEQVQSQLPRTAFDPTNVHPGAGYDPIFEFRFRWSRSLEGWECRVF